MGGLGTAHSTRGTKNKEKRGSKEKHPGTTETPREPKKLTRKNTTQKRLSTCIVQYNRPKLKIIRFLFMKHSGMRFFARSNALRPSNANESKHACVRIRYDNYVAWLLCPLFSCLGLHNIWVVGVVGLLAHTQRRLKAWAEFISCQDNMCVQAIIRQAIRVVPGYTVSPLAHCVGGLISSTLQCCGCSSSLQWHWRWPQMSVCLWSWPPIKWLKTMIKTVQQFVRRKIRHRHFIVVWH